MAKAKDPTVPIKLRASRYPGVDEGTACTQSSFKANTKGFLYIGEQGGRFKAMFKLESSIPEATKLAKKQPNNYAVGKGGWVTVRFSAEKPIPKKLWQRWLDESYEIAISGKMSDAKMAKKKTKRSKNTKKAAAKKKTKKRSI